MEVSPVSLYCVPPEVSVKFPDEPPRQPVRLFCEPAAVLVLCPNASPAVSTSAEIEYIIFFMS